MSKARGEARKCGYGNDYVLEDSNLQGLRRTKPAVRDYLSLSTDTSIHWSVLPRGGKKEKKNPSGITHFSRAF